MNTTSLAKSMNGALSVTDGEITIEEGQITFSDGSVLSSIGDIALKSADNTFTGDNTFNNNITMVAEIPTSIFHLTNKSYVDDAISQQRLNLLASNNTFTGINTFSNKLITTDISNNGLINDLKIGRWGDELGSILFGESATTRTGMLNTIIGTNTFKFNTTGSLNTVLGRSALRFNTIGEANTAIGGGTLYSNTTGGNNVGVGFGPLFSNTIGGKNSAIGYYSGTNQKTGNNNTFLGSNTQVASLTQTYNNSTAIGYNSSIDASNQIVVGTANEYVKIPSTKVSSDYTTGALVVAGGVGVAGNLIVNQNITTNGTLDVSGATVFKSDVSMTSTKISSSYTNGALVVAGGVGIAGNLRVNGRCIFNDILSAYNDVYFSTNLVVNQNMTVNTDLNVSGITTLTSSLIVNGTTASTSSTSGALKVVGGVGVGGALNVNGALKVSGASNVGALNVDGSLFSSYNANGGSITYPGSGYAFNWNIPGGNAETNIINIVPAGAYFDRGFNFHNVVAGVAFTSSNVPMFTLNAITSTLRTNLNVSGIITASSKLNVSGIITATSGISLANGVPSIQNKRIALYDHNPAETDPTNTIDFYGFGINSNTLRYQVKETTSYHRFYNGSTLNLEVGNGKVNVATDLSVGSNLTINNELLYFKASSGVNRLLKKPLYTWSFAVASNTTYTLNLATQGLSNYLAYPFEVRVRFHPINITYPVYDITNQAFVYNFDTGFQISYSDENTMKLRTGDTWVAMIYNHASSAYQYQNTGTYFVYLYP